PVVESHRLELLGSTCREPVIATVVACREFFQPQSQSVPGQRQKRAVVPGKGDNQQPKRDLAISSKIERCYHRLEQHGAAPTSQTPPVGSTRVRAAFL